MPMVKVQHQLKPSFIKCRIEDVVQATRVLSQLYGSTAVDWDLLCPLMRFIPMATLKSSEPVTCAGDCQAKAVSTLNLHGNSKKYPATGEAN